MNSKDNGNPSLGFPRYVQEMQTTIYKSNTTSDVRNSISQGPSHAHQSTYFLPEITPPPCISIRNNLMQNSEFRNNVFEEESSSFFFGNLSGHRNYDCVLSKFIDDH